MTRFVFLLMKLLVDTSKPLILKKDALRRIYLKIKLKGIFFCEIALSLTKFLSLVKSQLKYLNKFKKNELKNDKKDIGLNFL